MGELEVKGNGVPLALRRRALADGPVVRALAALRRAFTKPIRSPRQEVSLDTLLPEFAEFRALGRLLALQQEVYLADGRVRDAIETARTCLHLGQAIQTDTMISGLVGIAISAICIRRMGDHLEQLAVPDCDHLFKVCGEWLAMADPYPRILQAERRAMAKVLADLRSADRKRLGELFGLELDDPNGDPAEQLERRQTLDELAALESSPGRKAAVLDDVGRLLDGQYRRALAEAEKPPWERARLEPVAEQSLPGRLADMLYPALNRVQERYTEEMARVRLLACHAAILRYRWEHGRPPRDLAGLRLGQLVVDPFTGRPLEYRSLGYRYELASAGPEDPGTGGRRPVELGR